MVGITVEELVVVELVADVAEVVGLDAGGLERAVLLWEEYVEDELSELDGALAGPVEDGKFVDDIVLNTLELNVDAKILELVALVLVRANVSDDAPKVLVLVVRDVSDDVPRVVVLMMRDVSDDAPTVLVLVDSAKAPVVVVSVVLLVAMASS
jgi:hypothetical protein